METQREPITMKMVTDKAKLTPRSLRVNVMLEALGTATVLKKAIVKIRAEAKMATPLS